MAALEKTTRGSTPRFAVIADDARAAASTSGNAALIVETEPRTSGRTRRVASTITPRVPSEPMKSAVRS